MTGRFDKYLLGQLLMLFGFFALVLVLVYWINRAVLLFDQLIANGQSALVFLEFSALSLPSVISIVLPIAAFAGTVYVINRLTTESELVVVQATGFSPWRLMRPVFLFGVFVFAMASVLVHVLVPISTARLADRTVEISENMTARLLSEGRFLHPSAGVTFYIREISSLGELRNIFLEDSRNPEQRLTYTAKEALLLQGETAPTLLMIDGMAQAYNVAGKRLSVTRFDDFTYNLDGLIAVPTAKKRSPGELFTGDLFEASDETLALTGRKKSVLIAIAHSRIGNSLMGLVAPLIGFAALLLGGFSRFGVWRQILGAILAVIVVQMLTQSGQGMVRKDASLWPAAYLGPVVGLLMSLGMIYLASNPSLLRRKIRKAAP